MIDILTFPLFYNLRVLIAGNQKLTQHFIKNNYHKYHCHSILDVGCGTGDFSSLFPNIQYLGIDFNKRYVRYAQKKYHYQFICGEILKYNFKTQSFDASMLISTLHHLNDEKVKKIFPKIVRLTKKIVIIVDLNPQTSIIKRALIKIDRGKFIRTTEEKIAMLSQFGKIIEISHFCTGLASQTGIVLLPYDRRKK